MTKSDIEIESAAPVETPISTEIPKDEKTFEQVVAESHSTINDQMLNNEPKKKRGPYKKRDGSTAAPEKSAAPIVEKQAIGDISGPLKLPLIAISKGPAIKYQIPELAFSDEEASMLAQSISELANAFIPDVNTMNPKVAAVMSFGLVASSIGFSKYMIFQEKYRPAFVEKAPEKQTENKELQNAAPVMAGSIFQKVQV